MPKMQFIPHEKKAEHEKETRKKIESDKRKATTGAGSEKSAEEAGKK